jgi:nicotinamide-nucleotide amidase
VAPGGDGGRHRNPQAAASERVAAELGRALLARGWRLAAAESCTGGLAAAAITAVAGSSAWFDRGFVTYSNEAKCEMLGVAAALIEQQGAVSEDVARAMADGACAYSTATCAFSITGVAGPAGGTAAKPVGLVCFGWRVAGSTRASTRHLPGDRAAVRATAVDMALQGMLDAIAATPLPPTGDRRG